MFSEDLQASTKGVPPPTGPLTFLLNSDEAMFLKLRDLNFRAVGHVLSKTAKSITAEYKVRRRTMLHGRGGSLLGADIM